MGKLSKQYLKVGALVISLFALAACSSTSDMEEDTGTDTASSNNSNNTGSSASSNAGSNSGQLTQDEIRAQNALRQTVFYFDFDIAEFKQADRDTLTFHARDLAANPGKRVRLEGHADERGTREYNLPLGVRAYLERDAGSMCRPDTRKPNGPPAPPRYRVHGPWAAGGSPHPPPRYEGSELRVRQPLRFIAQ